MREGVAAAGLRISSGSRHDVLQLAELLGRLALRLVGLGVAEVFLCVLHFLGDRLGRELLDRRRLLGEDRKAGRVHVREAAANEEAAGRLAVGDRDDAGAERGHQRRVVGHDRHVALDAGDDDAVHGALEDELGGRDEFEMKRGHRIPFDVRGGIMARPGSGAGGAGRGSRCCGSRSLRSGRFGRELLRLGDGFLDVADHVEGGLGEMVVLAGAEVLEALDRVLERHELARRAGEDLGDVEGLAEEALNLPGARTVSLSSSDSSSMPRMAMMSCSAL